MVYKKVQTGKEMMVINEMHEGIRMSPSAEVTGMWAAEHRGVLTPVRKHSRMVQSSEYFSGHTTSLFLFGLLYPKPRALEFLPFSHTPSSPRLTPENLDLLTGIKVLNKTALCRKTHCCLISVSESHWLCLGGCGIYL